ncbi:hypothetical protein E3Z27_18745 [Pseudomonas mediterranea]|uniref:hypothetical protein n=1 Tax=Pseudomonas mediterranea TaxID=183795 RepID=UPI0013196117|nr:hypothetical protein [Pseudomonas mediterranea]QHA83569.1 hypothetical protein E3Z27_18745 [Pseudomonas mediterranea]
MELQSIKDQIPYYLTQEAAKGLLNELKNYSDKTDFYTSRYPGDFLQGDGWHGFTVFDFHTGAGRPVKAMVLSNSCDISTDNAREMPPKITFVPLIKFDKLQKLFEDAGKDPKAVQQKMLAIREQKNTSFFFLPAQSSLPEDYVAWLSDVHSMPSSIFIDNEKRSKFFTLNMTGFYLFLFKLSIHFCRFHENLDRSKAT